MSGVLIQPAAGDLRRTLGPVAWFVLEELLLSDAAQQGERRVVTASARSLATALSLNKDTVARALRSLTIAGVVEPARLTQQAGRFVAGRYRVASLPGVAGVPGHPPQPAQPYRPAATRRRDSSLDGEQLSFLDAGPTDPGSHPRAPHEQPPRPSDALAPGVPGAVREPSRSAHELGHEPGERPC